MATTEKRNPKLVKILMDSSIDISEEDLSRDDLHSLIQMIDDIVDRLNDNKEDMLKLRVRANREVNVEEIRLRGGRMFKRKKLRSKTIKPVTRKKTLRTRFREHIQNVLDQEDERRELSGR